MKILRLSDRGHIAEIFGAVAVVVSLVDTVPETPN